MNFEVFRNAIADRFEELTNSHDNIFEVAVDKDELYATYLASFPAGANPIFRKRAEHDCSCCRHFIRDVGAAVFINEDLTVHTVWEVHTGIVAYDAVATAMDALKLIARYNNSDTLMYLDPPYLRSTRKSGALYNHEMDEAEQVLLLDLITKSRAKIIISGYESDLYNRRLAGWYKDSTQSQTTSAEMATETIWMNYEPPAQQYSFWEDEIG